MDYNEVYAKTKSLIVEYLRINEDELQPETNLVDELGIDSIAMVELSFQFSETFQVPMIDADPDLYVMKNLVDYLYNQVKE
jgi:acyl carrier protein